MGNRLIFLYQLEVTDLVNCMSLMDWTCSEQVPRNSSNIDRTINRHRWSGGQVENTEADEITLVKELGKM